MDKYIVHKYFYDTLKAATKSFANNCFEPTWKNNRKIDRFLDRL